ncbi:MAG: hypothetical protein JJD92_14195 [Frankiaceae bacterium]|nr:hypothetical protein [Frankiaceae bacterium]
MHSKSAGRLASILAEQSDVIAYFQVIAAGCDSGLPTREVAAGRWQQPIRGVYVAGTGELTYLQRAWCAQLVGGEEAVVSGPLGCHVLGIPDSPSLIAVAVVPSGCHRHGDEHYQVRRSAAEQVWGLRGRLRLAGPTRAVIDACRITRSLQDVRALVCGAIRAKHTTYQALVTARASEPRAGLGLLGRALQDWADGARSAPEAEVADVLRDEVRAGRLPPFLLNPNVYDGAVLLGAPDVYVPGCSLGAETDSVRHHGSEQQLSGTLSRHQVFERAGIVLEHVTPSRFRQSPRAWGALFSAMSDDRCGLGDPKGLRIEPIGPLQPVPGRRRPR